MSEYDLGSAEKERNRRGWLLLCVPLIVLVLTKLYPLARLLYYSFHMYSPKTGEFEFIGLSNFSFVLKGTIVTGGNIKSFLLLTIGTALAPDKLAAAVLIPLALVSILRRVDARTGRLLQTAFMLPVISGAVWITALFIFPSMMHALRAQGKQGFWAYFHLLDSIRTISFALPLGTIFFQLTMPRAKGVGLRYLIAAAAVIFAFSYQSSSAESLINLSLTENLMTRFFSVFFFQVRPGRAAVYAIILILPVMLTGGVLALLLEKKGVFMTSNREASTKKPPLWTYAGWFTAIIFAGLVLLLLLSAFFYAGTPRYGITVPRYPVPGLLPSVLRTFFWGAAVIIAAVSLSWLGGYSLGRYRPKGGTSVTVLLYLTAFISPVLTVMPLLLDASLLGLESGFSVAGFGLASFPIGTLLFKMYYSGEQGKRTRAGAAMVALFCAVLQCMASLNSVLLPLAIDSPEGGELFPAFLYRTAFSTSGRAASDIMAYSLVLYLPALILLLVLLGILSCRFFPFMRIDLKEN